MSDDLHEAFVEHELTADHLRHLARNDYPISYLARAYCERLDIDVADGDPTPRTDEDTVPAPT